MTRTSLIAVTLAVIVLVILIAVIPGRRPVRPPSGPMAPAVRVAPLEDGSEAAPPEGDFDFEFEPRGEPRDFEAALAAALAAVDPALGRTAFAQVSDSIRTREHVTRSLEVWQSLTDLRARDALLQATLRGWARLDPGAAARWIADMAGQSLTVARLRSALLQTVLMEWARDDAAAACAFAAALPDATDRNRLLPGLVALWGSRSPRAVAAALSTGQIDVGNLGSTAWHSIVRAWANADIEDCVAFLNGQSPDHPARQFWPVVLDTLAAADPQRALALAATLDESMRAQAVGAVFKRWAGQAPDAAYAYLTAHPEALAIRGVVAEVAAALAAARPGEALQLIDRMADPAEAKGALGRMLWAWAEKDPMAAWEYAQALPADHPGHGLAQSLLGRISGENSAEALRRAEGVADPAQRLAFVRRVVQAWARQDPDAAWAYLERQTDPAYQDTRVEVLSVMAGQGHIERALSLAETIPAGKVRDSLYRMLTMAWANRDPKALLAADLPEFDAAMKAQVLQMAISRVAATDPASAVSLAADIADVEQRRTLRTSAFLVWVRQDPLAALDALEKAADVDTDAVRAQAVADLAEIDLDRARRVAAGVEDATLRGAALRSLAVRWADLDPRQALTWYVREAPPDVASVDTVRGLLEKWSWRSDGGGAEAAAWIEQQGTEHPVEVLNMFVERLARHDADAAWRYAQRLPDNAVGQAVRQTAYGMAIRELARTDGRKAAEWLAQAQDYTPDNRVLAEVVFNWAQQAPAAAAEWVGTFPDDHPGRAQAIGDVYSQWSRTDRAAARAWYERMQGRPPVSDDASTR